MSGCGNGLSQMVVYYQCNCCSKYLSSCSSSKWEQHWNKCLTSGVGSNDDGGGGSDERIPSSVGFRLITFKKPVIVIERCDSKVGVHMNQVTSQDQDSIQGIGASKTERGRSPRKSSVNAREKLHSVCSEMGMGEDEDEHSSPSRRTKTRTYKKRKSSTATRTNTKRTKRSTTKFSDLPSGTSEDEERAKNTSVPHSKSKKRVVQRATQPRYHPTCCRKYSFMCHLCPGKFYTQKELDVHVNSVHYGKRRLMACCVCGRVFNKRDSLNAHILAHEAAEAREVKFNLLQPWGEELLDYLKKYKINYKNTGNNCFVVQQRCKFCLLPQSSYQSFISHIHEEHTASPETYEFPCKFDNCAHKFSSIRVLVEHIKVAHPKFQGKLTRMRLNEGVYTGKRALPVWKKKQLEANTETKYKPTTPKKAKLKRKRKPTVKRSTKPVKSFTAFQDPVSDSSSDGEGDVSDWERECRDSIKHIRRRIKVKANDDIPQEKKIELESVLVDDQGKVSLSRPDFDVTHVKREVTLADESDTSNPPAYQDGMEEDQTTSQHTTPEKKYIVPLPLNREIKTELMLF